MDPLSIAAFAATGAKVLVVSAKLLESFRRATNDIDRSVEALQALTRGLAGVLNDLGKALENPVLSRGENTDLWNGVQDEIKSCRETSDEIDRKLAPLKEVGSNYALQAWRTFRLQLSQPDLERLISNMRTHSTNLQLALQTVTAVIAASIPGAINTHQAARFERLERMIDALGMYLDPAAGVGLLEARRSGPRALLMDRNTTQLYLTARSIVEGSVGGTIRSSASDVLVESPPQEEPVFEDFAPIIADTSAVGSRFDYRLDEGKRANISEWMDRSPDLKVTEHVSRALESDSDSDEDSGDYLALTLAKSSFTRGMRAYSEERFSEARAYLKIGIDKAKSLNAEQKEQLGLPSMQFHHALSCIVESSLSEAESSFRLVIEGSGSRETDTRLRCFAFYQLAKIQLRISKHDSAEKYCKRAIARMHRIEQSTGEPHTAYFDALRLLALISWAKGDKPMALVTVDSLPPEKQIAEDAFDEELARLMDSPGPQMVVVESPDVGPSPTSLPASPNEDPVRTQTLSVSETQVPESLRPMSQYSAYSGSIHSEFTRKTSKVSTGASSLGTMDANSAHRTINSKKFHGKNGVNKGLCWAAEKDRLDVLEELLKNPLADVDIHKSGFMSAHDTPLMIAASNGHTAICELLLDANSTVNLVSRGRTAINCAIQTNRFSICQLLLDRGACYDWVDKQEASPLGSAAHRSNLPICQLLLDRGADPNEKLMYVATGRRTALMQAASVDNIEVIRWLLDHGVLPDGPKPATSTPLIEASRAYSIDACRLLLERRADPRLQTELGKTASRATGGWLRKFIDEWPGSRDWKKPEVTMTLQP